MRLGIHISTSGSLEGAARQAADLGANTFQIFSASPRMWRARAPHPQQVRLLAAARHRYDLHPLVIHVNYLINLTHPNLRRKPFILETPVDRPGDDRRNLDQLKSLATRL